mmetsp:Transcript_65246/g.182461  ORF Transcript_65246/g.182461 Transcript_65246/m.182461 type:complete len:333 (+) Transcript_65246:468-1466(+)
MRISSIISKARESSSSSSLMRFFNPLWSGLKHRPSRGDSLATGGGATLAGFSPSPMLSNAFSTSLDHISKPGAARSTASKSACDFVFPARTLILQWSGSVPRTFCTEVCPMSAAGTPNLLLNFNNTLCKRSCVFRTARVSISAGGGGSFPACAAAAAAAAAAACAASAAAAVSVVAFPLSSANNLSSSFILASAASFSLSLLHKRPSKSAILSSSNADLSGSFGPVSVGGFFGFIASINFWRSSSISADFCFIEASSCAIFCLNSRTASAMRFCSSCSEMPCGPTFGGGGGGEPGCCGTSEGCCVKEGRVRLLGVATGDSARSRLGIGTSSW